MAMKTAWMMAIIARLHAHHGRDGAGVLGRVKGALPAGRRYAPLVRPACARWVAPRVMGIPMPPEGVPGSGWQQEVGSQGAAKGPSMGCCTVGPVMPRALHRGRRGGAERPVGPHRSRPRRRSRQKIRKSLLFSATTRHRPVSLAGRFRGGEPSRSVARRHPAPSRRPRGRGGSRVVYQAIGQLLGLPVVGVSLDPRADPPPRACSPPRDATSNVA